ncbi:35_t:CDS:2, partial [Diversispora eburnea]
MTGKAQKLQRPNGNLKDILKIKELNIEMQKVFKNYLNAINAQFLIYDFEDTHEEPRGKVKKAEHEDLCSYYKNSKKKWKLRFARGLNFLEVYEIYHHDHHDVRNENVMITFHKQAKIAVNITST